MESYKELLVLIQNAAQKYDEADELVNKIDEFCESISENQQRVDFILSDLYHEIENDDLTDEQMTSFGKEIKKYRKIRRSIDYENIIRNVYERHKAKISIREQRPFFRNSMKQCIEELNQPYKNRVLTDADINELKMVTKTSTKDDSKETLSKNKELTKKGKQLSSARKSKNVRGSVKIDLQELKLHYLKGTSQTQLAIMFNCTQPTINYYIKKIKKEEGNK